MVKKLIAAVLCLPAVALAQEKTFKIQGQVKTYQPGAKVFLAYAIPGKMIIDSCTIKNGEFSFTGITGGNKRAYLQMLHKDAAKHSAQDLKDALGVYLEEGVLQVETTDSLKNAKIGGTALNNLEQQLRATLAPFAKTKKKIEADFAQAKRDGNLQKQNEIQTAYSEMDAMRKNMMDGFIMAHKNNFIALGTLRAYVNPAADADRAIRLFDQLDESIRTGQDGILYANTIAGARKTTIGVLAPGFSAITPEGKEISLSSLKGKYVLIDFWASWCGPCRAENPNVVKAYQNFKDKNFTIIGVSLDGGNDAKEKWVKAIEADHLTWNQVSDLNGWESEFAKKYGVRAIPANFLIDPSGKIVAKNLRGTSLEQKLSELL